MHAFLKTPTHKSVQVPFSSVNKSGVDSTSSFPVNHSSSDVGSKKSLQPSLSGLAAKHLHLQKRTGQINLSSVALQHSDKGKPAPECGSSSLQPHLSSANSQPALEQSLNHNLSASGLQVASDGRPMVECMISAKTCSKCSVSDSSSVYSTNKSSLAPSLSSLSYQHAAGVHCSAQSSISNAPFLQPGVFERPKIDSPSVENVCDGLLNQRMSGATKRSVPSGLISKKSSQGSSLSSLAAQHLSKRSECTADSSNNKDPAISGLLVHTEKPLQPLGGAPANYGTGLKPCWAPIQSASLLQPLQETCLVPLTSSNVKGTATSGSPSSYFSAVVSVDGTLETFKEIRQDVQLKMSPLKCGQMQSNVKIQSEVKNGGNSGSLKKGLGHFIQNKVEPPPGFKALQTKSHDETFAPGSVEYPGHLCPESISGDPKCTFYACTCRISQHLPPTQAEPSLFSVTLCGHNLTFSKVEHVEVRTRTKMLYEFESLALFNFLACSPDDATKNKQSKGFQAHL